MDKTVGKTVQKIMGAGEKQRPVKSLKLKVKFAKKKKKVFGSKGFGKKFTRQQSKKPTPPRVKGGTGTGKALPDGNFFKKKRKSYATSPKFQFKRKAKKVDKVDTRPIHTWGKHDTYVASQGSLKQIKEKNMGNKKRNAKPQGFNKKDDTPHTLRYKSKKKKMPMPPVPEIATGAPAMKRRKSLLQRVKGAGSMGSGKRFKAFKKFRGG